MEFQVQALVKKEHSIQKNIDDLDIFVGLHSPLESPYNIFLRVKDIEENSDIIYFYAYSLGVEKAVIWGLYDRVNNEFLIDNSCQYHPSDLKDIIDKWKQNNYQFFFTAMRNRKDQRINQNIIYGNSKNEVNSLLNKFKKLYIQKLINEGILNISNLKTQNEDFDEDVFNNIVNQAYIEGSKAIKNKHSYENIKPTLELIFNNIDTKEDETAIKQLILGDMNGNEFQKNVAKHILIHVFVLTFLSVDEYRIAKYIDYIDLSTNNSSTKNSELLIKYVKGTFLYEWLLEFGKALRVYDIPTFMRDISRDIIRFSESNINMINVGVIGGSKYSPEMTALLEDIAVIFEDFVSKSVYSKISYVKNLTLCPTIKTCELNNDKCDLYSHGYKTTSKYDFQ